MSNATNALMEQEIQEAIAKSLPNQVGEVLKKRLEKADRDLENLVKANETIATKNARISDLEAQVKRIEKVEAAEEAVAKREKEVAEQERQQKIDELTYQLDAEKSKTAFATSIGLGLVRNTEFRKTMMDSTYEGGYWDANTQTHVNPVSRNQTKTDTTTAD